jgi:hypothetical protein
VSRDVSSTSLYSKPCGKSLTVYDFSMTCILSRSVDSNITSRCGSLPLLALGDKIVPLLLLISTSSSENHCAKQRWIYAEHNRRYIVIRKPNTKERISGDSASKIAILTENGVEENVLVVCKHIKRTIPRNITINGPRAVINTAIAGILYLL